MGCTIEGHKTFLLVCNIGSLFLGVCILVLGVKMKFAILILLQLDIFATFARAISAAIATGFLITITGATGICGSCYEVSWLLCVHLGGLGVIVIMEFALGVTLMVLKNSVDSVIDTANCGYICTASLKSIVFQLAMPSAGLMMTIIIMQALMIYSGVTLFFYFRGNPKSQPAAGTTVVVQNVQMQNVGAPPPPQPVAYPMPQVPVQPGYAQPTAAYPMPQLPVQPGYAQPGYAQPPVQQPGYAQQPPVQQPGYAQQPPVQQPGYAQQPPVQQPVYAPQQEYVPAQPSSPPPPPYENIGNVNVPEGQKADFAGTSTPIQPSTLT